VALRLPDSRLGSSGGGSVGGAAVPIEIGHAAAIPGRGQAASGGPRAAHGAKRAWARAHGFQLGVRDIRGPINRPRE
jgi:hypothetical protein